MPSTTSSSPDEVAAVQTEPVDQLLNALVSRLLEQDGSSKSMSKGKKKNKGRAPSEEQSGENKAPAEDVAEESTSTGMLADYKPFYEHRDKDGKCRWTIEEPEGVAEPVEGKATAKYAFLVRMRVSNDTRKKYDIDSVIVQSPLLKELLGTALAGYPGITTSLDRLVFKAPFRPFVHRWQRLTSLLESSDHHDPVATEHLRLFLDLLYTELKQPIDAKLDLLKAGVITFDHLWTIFEPETLVFGSEYEPRIWELKQNNYAENQSGVPYLALSVWSVDFDGNSFGRSSSRHAIGYFEGTARITSLNYYPLEFHPEKQVIARKLIERGRLFAALAGYHYKYYIGVALGYGRCGMVRHNVDTRIIVDADAHNRLLPNQAVSLAALGKETTPFVLSSDDDLGLTESDESFVATPASSNAVQAVSGRPLTTKELLLSVPFVRGFSLRTKNWLWFFVEQISDIVFNGDAFNALVLPQHQKRLINAFVRTQARYKGTFDDVIAGKGRGMIMLLSGPPGVGKTLTAESVSENLRVPLYMMSAGDLGLEPSQIEQKLTTVMDMVAKWNAVLLLDEADVFLEARSVSDLERNKLVSIFLRLLEYYEGILFLTTNRINNIDLAFHSRIHVTIQYPQLSQASRRHIWKNFLAGKDHSVSEEDIDSLSELDLNGRVIKNTLKTALMISRSEKEDGNDRPARVDLTHIRTVLAIEDSTE